MKDLNNTSPQQLEADLAAAARAPRVTLDQVMLAVTDEHYLHHGTLTICILTLYNGFNVTGESAAASPENYDAETGKRLARARAVEKVWPLLGFRLRDRIHQDGERVQRIARMAHEVNRAYCASLGDDSQPAWELAPQWQRDSAINGVKFHLANPDADPEMSHRNWMAEKLLDGWTWGPVKDPEKKQHHCMVSYKELPQEQRSKDWLFRGVVHAMRDDL